MSWWLKIGSEPMFWPATFIFHHPIVDGWTKLQLLTIPASVFYSVVDEIVDYPNENIICMTGIDNAPLLYEEMDKKR